MGITNVQQQLSKAVQMRESVFNFSSMLRSRVAMFNENLDFFVRAGFPEDLAMNYRARYFSSTENEIEELCGIMLSRHVEFLDSVIENLEKVK